MPWISIVIKAYIIYATPHLDQRNTVKQKRQDFAFKLLKGNLLPNLVVAVRG